MAQLEFTLRVVSPMFLNGADTRQPEMRAASVRGQLRYWLRAILGAQTDDLDRIWERESAAFGSTGQGSAVTVRLFSGKPQVIKAAMLPHRTDESKRSEQKAISPGQLATLQLVTRPGINMPEDVMKALKIWAFLGGLGKRSRRMFGAVQITGKDWLPSLGSPQELADQIKQALGNGIPVAKNLYIGQLPSFPTLHPQHSWIIVGTKPFEHTFETYTLRRGRNEEEITRAMFVKDFFDDLLRKQEFRAKERTFGSASPRRSAPLIAQVRQIGDDFYPVLTAIRSRPDSNIDWSHLKKFMQAATQYYNGIHVWGGW